MNEQRSLFYAFRYLVSSSIPPDNLFKELIESTREKSKEELMSDIFNDLYSSGKTQFVVSRTEYFIFGVKKYEKKLFLFNFAKKERVRKSVEGQTSIEIIEDEHLKHVLLFVHAERQIILIENKPSAFQEINFVVRRVESYLNDRMRNHDFNVNLYPISSPEQFWEKVQNAEAIYELSLTVNAPNIGGGNQDLREVIANLHEQTNNEQTTLEVKNKKGDLNIKRSFWEDPIEYVSRIGGKYLLVFQEDGAKKRQTNQDNIEKTYIERHLDQEYTDEELENVEIKIEGIDRRSTDGKNNE